MAALDRILAKMKTEWEERARTNARHFIQTEEENWQDSDFFRSGQMNVDNEIVPDLEHICRGADPRALRVLEIGCGVGRITRALAHLFGEVHAVDISAEMIHQARVNLADLNNAFVYVNNGADLQVLPSSLDFDFAFSFIVFQHIPSKEVIESYISEVSQRLKPGCLFKFQVQGAIEGYNPSPDDTWLGASFTPVEMEEIARRHGFEMAYNHGAGSQYFWLWFIKQ
jgi:cyclopropane fatty-acyl-phospholipid synthase-like methyltransferase